MGCSARRKRHVGVPRRRFFSPWLDEAILQSGRVCTVPSCCELFLPPFLVVVPSGRGEHEQFTRYDTSHTYHQPSLNG